MNKKNALEKANSIADNIEESLSRAEFDNITIKQLKRNEGNNSVKIIVYLKSFSPVDKKKNPNDLKNIKEIGSVHSTVNAQTALTSVSGPYQIHFEIPLANWTRDL